MGKQQKETFLQKLFRRANRIRNKSWTLLIRLLGPSLRIYIGKKTTIHWGATLSTAFGGSITIGQSCTIMPSVRILTYEGDIKLGSNCSVNYNTIINGHGGVTIGDNVRIAANSFIIPANHTFSDTSIPISRQPETREGITIDDDVWIASGVTVLDGVHIARGCVIAAGAVVNKSTVPMGIYAGLPARLIKTRNNKNNKL